MTMVGNGLKKLDWIGSITIVPIAVDLASRILAQQYTQPVFFDSLVTLAVGFWFAKN
jgi:hypothetical protein